MNMSKATLTGLLFSTLRRSKTTAFTPIVRGSWQGQICRMASASALDVALLAGKIQIPIVDAIQRHNELVFVDGSWWLGQRETTNRYDYETGPRIRNARFLDIDDVCLPKDLNPKGLPHMMPTPQIFAAAMDAMNIRNDDHVVVYGQAKCPFLHRTWLQFAAMGHEYNRLHLLEGSLQDWIDANGPIDEEPTSAIRVADLDLTMEPQYQSIPPRNVCSFGEMHQIIADKRDDTTIVDVRSPDRFWGKVPEPRPGLFRGHMPGAKNLFFLSLLNENNPTVLKPREELRSLIEESLGSQIWQENHKVVATCGSGATACALAVALVASGKDPADVAIYDGSWAEWGLDASNPMTMTDQ